MASWIGPWEIALGAPFWIIGPYVALIFFLLTLTARCCVM